MDKRYKLIILVSFIVGLIIISTIFFYGDQKDNENNSPKLSYKISIETNTTNNYTIIVPIPEGWNDFSEDLVITKGNASISETVFNEGPAIKIESFNNLNVNVTKEKLENRVDFSWAYMDEGMKVFCNKTNVHQNIVVKGTYNDESNVQYDFEGEIKDGWQYIDIEGVSP